MGNQVKKVSVVVTCYNYGKYLKHCLDSVLAQTYANYEIIVVDDGSTDSTPQVMESFKELRNLLYCRQKNAGQANAKNAGIIKSSGEFVAFLDADDMWCADKLEKQIKCFENKDVGVVYCRANYLDEDSNIISYDMTNPYLQPKRGIVTDWLFFDNFVQFSSTIVRRECFQRFGLFDESLKMGIDWDLWLRISTSYKFDYVDERLFYYRMGHSGQMSKNLEERQRCSDRIMEDFVCKYQGVLSPDTISKAYAMTYYNRGEYYRNIDLKKSYKYFADAIKKNPAAVCAYKGLIKNVLRSLIKDS